MKTKIYKDYYEFSQRENRDENGVSQEFAKNNPDFERENIANKSCWNCSGCSDLKNAKPEEAISAEKKESIFDYPVIPNIHQRVFEETTKENALDMSDWHTCDTTHCRAGWVVFLAGEKGKKLESETSTLFAAMQIYNAYSEIKVSPTQYFKKNEEAMEDIKRCAELEKLS